MSVLAKPTATFGPALPKPGAAGGGRPSAHDTATSPAGNQARLRALERSRSSAAERRETEADALGARLLPALAEPVVAAEDTATSRGAGLSPTVIRAVQASFGHDFGRVRLMTDRASADAVDAVDADAFTIGANIRFGPGALQLGTPAGRDLLAHELAHVVQQQASGPRLDRRKKLNKEYAKAHGPADWSEDDEMNWRRDSADPQVTNSFISAAKYNTANQSPDEYTTIQDRSEYYYVMEYLAVKQGGAVGQTRFFQAAAVVTDPVQNGVGMIEAPAGWALHSAATIAVLTDVNKLLFNGNMKVINNLEMVNKAPTAPSDPTSKTAIPAIQFDFAMVEKEQGMVEDYLIANKAKITPEVVKDINDDLNLKGFFRTLGEWVLVDTMSFDWARKSLGVKLLDFTVKAHRIGIGRALVARLHGNSFEEYDAFMKTGVLPPEHIQAQPVATP